MENIFEKGGRVNIAGIEWIMLEERDGGVLCLAADIVEKRAFDTGNGNNWTVATLNKYLNDEFLTKIESKVGDDAVICQTIDLTADDGTDEYGRPESDIFLLSYDEYRRHSEVIPDATDWWWLVTPYSCKGEYDSLVRFVNSDGSLNSHRAYTDYRGVRPACVFTSSAIEKARTTMAIREQKVDPGVVQREIGNWQHISGDEWFCEVCGYVICIGGNCEHPHERSNYFCKNCGSDMRGVDDGDE